MRLARYSPGGGNLRMLVTLAGFIAGSVIGHHWQNWQGVPGFEPIALSGSIQHYRRDSDQSATVCSVYLTAAAYEKRRHGDVVAITVSPLPLAAGPWPLLAGAPALAAVNVAT